MGSIRPIITLTIIVVAGVFLFRKINEGPAQLTSTGETFQSATAGDAPALGDVDARCHGRCSRAGLDRQHDRRTTGRSEMDRTCNGRDSER